MTKEYILTVLVLAAAIGFVLIIRILGAWMLRINDVINELKDANTRLQYLNDQVDRIIKDNELKK